MLSAIDPANNLDKPHQHAKLDGPRRGALYSGRGAPNPLRLCQPRIGQGTSASQPATKPYRSEDVAALAARKVRSCKPAAIAAGSMAWGEPSVTTRICTVNRGILVYRGVNAVAFSQEATPGHTAQLLWQSDEPVDSTSRICPPQHPSFTGHPGGAERSIRRAGSRASVSRRTHRRGIPPHRMRWSTRHFGLAHRLGRALRSTAREPISSGKP
jgi:hypothetical protein